MTRFRKSLGSGEGQQCTRLVMSRCWNISSKLCRSAKITWKCLSGNTTRTGLNTYLSLQINGLVGEPCVAPRTRGCWVEVVWAGQVSDRKIHVPVKVRRWIPQNKVEEAVWRRSDVWKDVTSVRGNNNSSGCLYTITVRFVCLNS